MVRRKEGMGKEGRERGRGGKGRGRKETEGKRQSAGRIREVVVRESGHCSHPRYGKDMVIGWVTEWLCY